MNSKNNISKVATALLIDYTSVYYIDLDTGYYEAYSTNQGYQNLSLAASGDDFFADCARDIVTVVYQDDQELVSRNLTREGLRNIKNGDAVSFIYRLLIDGEPIYHTMRLIHDASDEDDCLILGVINVDNSIRVEKATSIYNSIAKTLADRYATIYYVELSNDHYTEYSSSNDYKDLDILPEGDDFFNVSAGNIKKFLHPDDQKKVLDVFEKEHFIALTENGKMYQIEYRLIMNGVAHYVRLKAMRSETEEQLIVAIENIDDEIKKDEAIKEISEKNIIFSHIAESLADQYGMIYYVDSETNAYVEFNSANEYKNFEISPQGNDFFGTSQRNVCVIIHPSDRERVFDALNKQNMLKALNENGKFTITYQLLLAEGASYTRMTAFWANDKKHIIIAIMSIDNEIQKENAIKKMVAENAVFSQIAESLANQYDTIYYVDMFTDNYLEFSSTDVYKSLDVRPSGDDFFKESKYNIGRVIYPEDRDSVFRVLDKTSLMQLLSKSHSVMHTYRLIIGSGIMYARMSIIWANDNKHIIVGVMNIDDEVRREQEVQRQLYIANEKAYRDDLTGVKNKGAFTEYEEKLQEQIDNGSILDFAILVCDVNGLKEVNDRHGHIEGDAYIRNASELICNIWLHSPVFRIGGDEFAVIIQGSDYIEREEKFEKMRSVVLDNHKKGNVVVATGMSSFDRVLDMGVSDVFERADSLMYENKKALKEGRL